MTEGETEHVSVSQVLVYLTVAPLVHLLSQKHLPTSDPS